MIQGLWWIPNKRVNKVSGALSASNAGLKLKLTGAFSDEGEVYRSDLVRVDEIYGVTLGGKNSAGVEKKAVGKFVILKGCREIHRNTPFRSAPRDKPIASSIFSASAIFITENSQDVRDVSLTFHEIRVAFSRLPDFAMTKGRLISDDFTYNEDGTMEKLQAIFAYPNLPKAELGGVSLEFAQGVSTSGDRIRRYTIEPNVRLKMRSQNPLSMPEWDNKFIRPFEHFLSLAIGQANFVTELRGFHDENISTVSLAGEQEKISIPIPFDVTNRQMLENSSKVVEEAYSPLFRIATVNENFGEVMQKWFSLYNEHRSVQNLLFGVDSIPRIYAEDRFLNLAKALEIYHAAKYPERKLMPRTQFRSLKAEILSQVDDKHRVWLREKLAWANEMTFHSRLLELFNELESPKFLGALEITNEKLSKIIKDRRNWLTHPTKEHRKKVKTSDLTWLSHLMNYCLRSLLLKEIGLSGDLILNDDQYEYRMDNIKQILQTL